MPENPSAAIRRPIVVGVDGSPESRAALEWAAREAVLWSRPLHLTHVFLWPVTGVPSLSPIDTGQWQSAGALLTEALQHVNALFPELDVRTSVSLGRAAASLVRMGHEAAMIVVGHRGHGGFAGLHLGSIAVQVSAHAPCPVAVVRSAEVEASGRVVVGVDVVGGSETALKFAFEEAAARGCGLAAVHAWTVPAGAGEDLPPVYDVDAVNSDEERVLAEVLATWQQKYPAVAVHHVVRHGLPPEVLIDAAAGAELLVVGSRGHGGFVGLLLGSVSQAVLHHASCPVVVVRRSARPASWKGESPA
jgi:nucleotide-binding universal stress UspA family protein